MTRSSYERTVVRAALALAALLAIPSLALAEAHEGTSVAEEIKAMILADNDYIRQNKTDRGGTVSQHGSLEFWSSGGLLQTVAPDAPLTSYESFTIRPKHIQVIELPGGEAAVAMYYSEGSMQPKGSAPVGHYMTRVLQVFVKEGGEWKARAAHWSAIGAGSGTSQTGIE